MQKRRLQELGQSRGIENGKPLAFSQNYLPYLCNRRSGSLGNRLHVSRPISDLVKHLRAPRNLDGRCSSIWKRTRKIWVILCLRQHRYMIRYPRRYSSKYKKKPGMWGERGEDFSIEFWYFGWILHFLSMNPSLREVINNSVFKIMNLWKNYVICSTSKWKCKKRVLFCGQKVLKIQNTNCVKSISGLLFTRAYSPGIIGSMTKKFPVLRHLT